jgi:hypothetical protein
LRKQAGFVGAQHDSERASLFEQSLTRLRGEDGGSTPPAPHQINFLFKNKKGEAEAPP